MKALLKSSGAALLATAALCSAWGQGTFQNLDFENARIVPSGPPGQVYAIQALPGWTDGWPSDATIWYDTKSIGAAAISIHDRNDPHNPPIAGRYSVLLQGSFPGAEGAGIGQTGQVPSDAQTLTFWWQLGSLQVTFAGQPLSYTAIGSGPNYGIYGADISAFAGQTGRLVFLALPNTGGGFIDNIQFSTQPIPEPGVLGLAALGALLFGWRVLRRPRCHRMPNFCCSECASHVSVLLQSSWRRTAEPFC